MAGVMSKKLSVNNIDTSGVHREVLSKVQDHFLRTLIFDPVHDFFVTKRVFDDITLDDIREEPKNSKQIRKLLWHLKRAEQRTYQLFKQGLRDTKQEHLAEKLVETENVVMQELIMERARAQQPTSDQLYSRCGSMPQPIPSSPIAQPTPSIDGSPSFNDVHKHS